MLFIIVNYKQWGVPVGSKQRQSLRNPILFKTKMIVVNYKPWGVAVGSKQRQSLRNLFFKQRRSLSTTVKNPILFKTKAVIEDSHFVQNKDGHRQLNSVPFGSKQRRSLSTTVRNSHFVQYKSLSTKQWGNLILLEANPVSPFSNPGHGNDKRSMRWCGAIVWSNCWIWLAVVVSISLVLLT